MTSDQLKGRYLRLQRELSAAYEARPWHPGQIDRLAAQIAETERQLAAQSRGTPDHSFAERKPRGVRESA